MTTRSVLTIAVGKPFYIGLAVNLARSFLFWNDVGAIEFRLVTDQPDLVPPDVRDRIATIEIRPGELGVGFSPKLHLDSFLETDAMLFVDADSLCYGSLEPVFARFAGQAVGTIGFPMSSGEFFGDVRARCERFGVESVPWFVGGLYYLERGLASARVFQMARELEAEYDRIGMRRLRGHPNEEPLVSLAMALHGLAGIPDDGTLKAEPMLYRTGMFVDVLTGRASLLNRPGHAHYNPDWQLTEARPRIVHFNGNFGEGHPYTSEATKLRHVLRDRWPAWLATTYAAVRHGVPAVAESRMKRLLRPAYRRIWGYRAVSASPRV